MPQFLEPSRAATMISPRLPSLDQLSVASCINLSPAIH
jgi:hypothetical protein